MAVKKRLSMLDMCSKKINKDNKIIKLQHEMNEVVRTIEFIEQGFLNKEMSEKIYNYYHTKYLKRKREIEISMDKCHMNMMGFEKFDYG